MILWFGLILRPREASQPRSVLVAVRRCLTPRVVDARLSSPQDRSILSRVSARKLTHIGDPVRPGHAMPATFRDSRNLPTKMEEASSGAATIDREAGVTGLEIVIARPSRSTVAEAQDFRSRLPGSDRVNCLSPTGFHAKQTLV